MHLRRTIAAFLVFALSALLSAPAFAGMLHLDTEGDGCCCAEEKTNETEEVEGPGCLCPSCACTIGEQKAPGTLYPTTSESVLQVNVALAPDAANWSDNDVAPQHAPAIHGARGPPDDGSPPLYILYDTYLI